MRLGISSYTYGWAVAAGRVSAIDLIERARSFGVDIVQLCDNLPAETFEPASLDDIAAHAERAGIGIELGTRGSRPQWLQQALAIAGRLGARMLRTLLDSNDDHPSEAEAIERLRPLLPELAGAGVTLAIENHDRFRADELATIIGALDSPHVGICLDTANSFGAAEGPEAIVDTLGPHVVNLHLKDFAIRRMPHLQGFVIEGRPAGEGMLDIPWLLAKLRQFGRGRCSAIAELWVPPENDMKQTIVKETEWAQRSVRTLRNMIG